MTEVGNRHNLSFYLLNAQNFVSSDTCVILVRGENL